MVQAWIPGVGFLSDAAIREAWIPGVAFVNENTGSGASVSVGAVAATGAVASVAGATVMLSGVATGAAAAVIPSIASPAVAVAASGAAAGPVASVAIGAVASALATGIAAVLTTIVDISESVSGLGVAGSVSVAIPPSAITSRQAFVPVSGFVDESGRSSAFVPGQGFISETLGTTSATVAVAAAIGAAAPVIPQNSQLASATAIGSAGTVSTHLTTPPHTGRQSFITAAGYIDQRGALEAFVPSHGFVQEAIASASVAAISVSAVGAVPPIIYTFPYRMPGAAASGVAAGVSVQQNSGAPITAAAATGVAASFVPSVQADLSGTATRRQPCGSRNDFPSTVRNSDGTVDSYNVEFWHYTPADIVNPSVVHVGYSTTTGTSGGETDFPNSETRHTQIQLLDGTVHEFKTGGASLQVVNPGDTWNESDQQVGLTIPAGWFIVRMHGFVPPGGIFYASDYPCITALGDRFEQSIGLADKSGGGTIPISSAHVPMPLCIMGDCEAGRQSWVLFGDSIEAGTGAGSGPMGGNGYQARYFDGKYDYVHCSRSGWTASGAVTHIARRLVTLSHMNFTDLVDDLGSNDFNSGASAASVAASTGACWDLIAAACPQQIRFWKTFLVPRVTITGAGSVSDGNQTPIPTSPQITLLNALTAALGQGGSIAHQFGYADAATAVQNTVIPDPQRWAANDSDDGIHPNEQGVEAMDAALTAANAFPPIPSSPTGSVRAIGVAAPVIAQHSTVDGASAIGAAAGPAANDNVPLAGVSAHGAAADTTGFAIGGVSAIGFAANVVFGSDKSILISGVSGRGVAARPRNNSISVRRAAASIRGRR